MTSALVGAARPATAPGGAGTPGMATRSAIIGALRDSLSGVDMFRAAWLGGSDATGRADAMSDVDLVCFVREGTADEGFAHVRSALERVAPVEREWRLPSPTWHAGEQAFYQLEGCPDYGLVDVVLAAHTPGFEFLVPERHGTPPVLFDHDGLVTPTRFDRAAHDEKVRHRVATARGAFALLSGLASKEAMRGRAIDAAQMYQHVVLRPLVDVLRAVHRPERFDFGLRYLGDDLPGDVAREIEALMYPGSAAAIPGLVERASELMDEALAAWDAGADARVDRRRAGPTLRVGRRHMSKVGFGEQAFYEWLGRQRDRRDPVGDFANDAWQDEGFPRAVSTAQGLVEYMEGRGSGEAARVAAQQAWEEFGVHAEEYVSPDEQVDLDVDDEDRTRR